MKLFGRSKDRQQEVEREARADLEARMANARPPTDAERTWVLPTPEVPDMGFRSAPPAAPRRSGGKAPAQAEAAGKAPAKAAKKRSAPSAAAKKVPRRPPS